MKLALFALLASTVSANAILSTSAIVQKGTFFCEPNCFHDSATGTTFASVSGVSSYANYGDLSIAVNFLAPSAGGSSYGSGSSSFIDTITIFGGTGPGTLAWHVDKGGCLIDCQGTYLFPLSFVFGLPFEISAAISVFESGTAGDYVYRYSRVTMLGGTEVKDASGTLLSGYHFQSESNAPYSFAGGTQITHNPEPATWATGLLGLLTLVVLRRRARMR